jgi:hypothetical protein
MEDVPYYRGLRVAKKKKPAAEEKPKPQEHVDPVEKPAGVDPATFIIDKLMSSSANVGLLLSRYQSEYVDDPIGVIERLLKLQPKADREKGKAPTDKPSGFRLVTGDGKEIEE